MKILMLTTSFPMTETDYHGIMVRNIVRVLADGDFDVRVVAPNFPGGVSRESLGDKQEIVRFRYFLPWTFQKVAYGDGIPSNLKNSLAAKFQLPFFLFFFFLKALLNSRDRDLIHSQWIFNGLIGVIVAKLTGKKCVLTVRRSVFRSAVGRVIARFVLENHDFVVFNSSYTRDRCLELADITDYDIIPSTVDTGKFAPDSAGMLRKKYGIPADRKIVLTAGFLIEKKGIEYLIKAFSGLRRQPDPLLVIIGTGYLEEHLKKMADDTGVSGMTLFCGKVPYDEMPHYFTDADIFVLPSIVDSRGETETLGMVLVEAMACGLPVVGTDAGGIPYVIEDDFGVIVPQKDPEKLRRNLEDLLADGDRLRVMGEKARESAVKRFSEIAVTEKYADMYKRLLCAG